MMGARKVRKGESKVAKVAKAKDPTEPTEPTAKVMEATDTMKAVVAWLFARCLTTRYHKFGSSYTGFFEKIFQNLNSFFQKK